MAREVAAIVCNASLRSVYEGQRALKSKRCKNRAQWLTCLGRIDRQSFARKILLAIVRALGPLFHPLKIFRGHCIFKHALFICKHLRVLWLTEQFEVINYLFRILTHIVILLAAFLLATKT